MNAPESRQPDRRQNDYPVWTDRRQAPRRVSPAVGEFAIQENAMLKKANRELLDALVFFMAATDEGSLDGLHDMNTIEGRAAAYDRISIARSKTRATLAKTCDDEKERLYYQAGLTDPHTALGGSYATATKEPTGETL